MEKYFSQQFLSLFFRYSNFLKKFSMRVLINDILISVRAKRTQFTENQETSTSFDPKKKQKIDDAIFID